MVKRYIPGTSVSVSIPGSHGVVQSDGRIRLFKGQIDARDRQINRWLKQDRNPDDGSRLKAARSRTKRRFLRKDHPGNKNYRKWIQRARLKRGALHRDLGIPQGQVIPIAVLRKAAKRKDRIGRRARIALNFRKMACKTARKLSTLLTNKGKRIR